MRRSRGLARLTRLKSSTGDGSISTERISSTTLVDAFACSPDVACTVYNTIEPFQKSGENSRGVSRSKIEAHNRQRRAGERKSLPSPLGMSIPSSVGDENCTQFRQVSSRPLRNVCVEEGKQQASYLTDPPYTPKLIGSASISGTPTGQNGADISPSLPHMATPLEDRVRGGFRHVQHVRSNRGPTKKGAPQEVMGRK